jgi:hypothetical protein
MLLLLFLITQFSDDTGFSEGYPKASIKGQTTVPVGGAVLLDGRDSKFDPTIGMVWHAIDPKDLIILTADKDNKPGSIAFFVADHVGKYEIALACAGYDANKRLIIDIDVHAITVGSPLPPPDPNPLPDPPPPATTKDAKWALLILPSDMSLKYSPLQLSVKIRDQLSHKGLGYRIYYDDDPVLDTKGYTKFMKDLKPPIILFQDVKGKVLTRAEVTSEDDVLKLLEGMK